MVIEIDVLWAEAVTAYKLLVSSRSLILVVASQHALKAHADTLNILHRAPSLLAQEVKADDSVGVDVRVNRDWSICEFDKNDFGRFCTAG